MKTHKPGTPEHSEAWQAAEVAKNQNGGMPPSGHTPGPWEAVQLTPSHWTSPEWVITGPRQGIGADLIGHCYRQRDNAEANARLIAAAPDLLAALEALTATARTFRNVPKDEQAWGPIDDEALDSAFAAILKAKH